MDTEAHSARQGDQLASWKLKYTNLEAELQSVNKLLVSAQGLGTNCNAKLQQSSIDCSRLQSKLTEAECEIKQLKIEVETERGNRIDAEQDVRRYQRELEQHQAKLLLCQASAQSVGSQIKEDRHRLSTQAATHKAQFDEAQSETAQNRAEIDRLLGRNSDLQREIDRLISQVAQLEARCMDAEAKSTRAAASGAGQMSHVSALSTEVGILSGKCSTLEMTTKHEQEAARAEIARLNSRCTEYEIELNLLKADSSRWKISSERYQSEADRLVSELSSANMSIRDSQDTKDSEIKRFNIRNGDCEAQLSQLQTELSKLMARSKQTQADSARKTREDRHAQDLRHDEFQELINENNKLKSR